MNAQQKPPPSYAPVYAAALYPELAKIARKHGYALAAHGSLQRDFDLIGIPWVEEPSEPEAVVAEFTSTFAIREIGGPPSDKLHGRRAWTLSIGHGECAIDLSFMPILRPNVADKRPAVPGSGSRTTAALIAWARAYGQQCYQQALEDAARMLMAEHERRWHNDDHALFFAHKVRALGEKK